MLSDQLLIYYFSPPYYPSLPAAGRAYTNRSGRQTGLLCRRICTFKFIISKNITLFRKYFLKDINQQPGKE